MLGTNILVVMSLSILAKTVLDYFQVPFDSYSYLIIWCFIGGIGGAFISLKLSKTMAKRVMGIVPADPRGELAQKIRFLAKRAGLKKSPEVYTYDCSEVNAFATGSSRNNSLVAVSTGLLENMNSDETEAVLAHEICHITNGDMVTMALVHGVVNSFVSLLTNIVMRFIMKGLGEKDSQRLRDDWYLHHMLHHGFYACFSFLSLPIVMGFSRWREYRADVGAARLVGKKKMIAALQGLKKNHDTLMPWHNTSIAVMNISGKPSFLGWFSSHPSLDDRILNLRRAGAKGLLKK